jgi:hypothetical protein
MMLLDALFADVERFHAELNAPQKDRFLARSIIPERRRQRETKHVHTYNRIQPKLRTENEARQSRDLIKKIT